MASPWQNVVLALSGGNALGAFQAGAYEALHDCGFQPDLVAGSSVGAVNGVLIAATPPDRRVRQLSAFWESVCVPDGDSLHFRRMVNLAVALHVRLVGHPGLFTPLPPRWFDWPPLGTPGLYSLAPLRDRLNSEVNFAESSNWPCPLLVNTTDLGTGEAVVLDSRHVLRAEHVQASCALPVDFEPVYVDRRSLGDGGLSANLPLEAALSPLPAQDTLCIAIGLLGPTGERHHSIDTMVGRRMDLLMSAQTRKDMEMLRLRHRLARRDGKPGSLTILSLTYRNEADEVGQKFFDYSMGSVRQRWHHGRRRMAYALELLEGYEPDGSFSVIEAP